MGNLAAIAKIADNRKKAKEITNRVIKRGNETGEKFGDILQEEVDKLKKGGNKVKNSLSEKISSYINENTIIACIGTDKCIGDCLGPLVGSLLEEKGFKFPVYGTLEKPIHALNMHERLNLIQNSHPNAEIIGIDACLGDSEEIGTIKIRDYAISPGKGVGKELPNVGIASIVGIVDSSENSELFFSRSIRLSFVMDMAKQIVEIIIKATTDTSIKLSQERGVKGNDRTNGTNSI